MSNLNSKIVVETTTNLVTRVYEKLQNNISKFRMTTDRPLTVCEKILIGHLESVDFSSDNTMVPGQSYVLLNPDRVALQDVTGQMTILQFMMTGLKQTVVPTTVHCDHLIQARVGGGPDTKAALYENHEVYQFLESASRKYGLGFWKPGAGITSVSIKILNLCWLRKLTLFPLRIRVVPLTDVLRGGDHTSIWVLI